MIIRQIKYFVPNFQRTTDIFVYLSKNTSSFIMIYKQTLLRSNSELPITFVDHVLTISMVCKKRRNK